ncbi:MAG: thiamine pyrophosphate-dependent dehydrogenase E1 component subunit alpha [Ottowia sp.]|nr:thiamine pyrophosphate-dependent dehydrogenase E1 component subunit alpha [Ottowia sp.]
MKPTIEQQLWMYKHMVTSRYLEESLLAVYMEGKTPVFNMGEGPIPGEMHLSNGQEPCAVGVCAHLTPTDVVTSYHRPHHVAVAKGVDLNRMVAEIMGKKTGLSGGRGGHMHLFDPTVNFSCAGIVAQGLAPAVGAMLSRHLQKKPGVAVAYLGEGATNAGAFHESLNLAAVWNLPVLFVVEDNSWGISVSKAQSTAVPRNDARAAGYGMPGVYVPGNDADAIFDAAGEIIERMRKGGGPALMELETYRLAGHFVGDAEGYRPEGEKEALQAKDPIPAYSKRLIETGALTDDSDRELVQAAHAKVDAAIAFGRESSYPDPEEAMQHVFA